MRCQLPLEEIDRALQTAHMLRLSEGAYARDNFGDLLQTRDASGRKLEAYSAGVLTALVYGNDDNQKILGVLMYALVVTYIGPGLDALARATRMLRSESDLQLRTYLTLGFCTVQRMLDDEPTMPGEFARLLHRN